VVGCAVTGAATSTRRGAASPSPRCGPSRREAASCRRARRRAGPGRRG
jgi:hypothetical protein